jgi:adenylate kinase family enzyme
MMSVLLEGPSGSGKTALAASAAIASQFPFAKVRDDVCSSEWLSRGTSPVSVTAAAAASIGTPDGSGVGLWCVRGFKDSCLMLLFACWFAHSALVV